MHSNLQVPTSLSSEAARSDSSPSAVSSSSSHSRMCPIHLAFVACCHSSRVAAVLVQTGAAAMAIAVDRQDAVMDDSTLAFSQKFYSALFAGHCPAVAFERAVHGVSVTFAARSRRERFVMILP